MDTTTTTPEPEGRGEIVMDAIEGGRTPAPTKKPKDLFAAPETAMLREQLAAIEHQRWADWMAYFLGKLDRLDDGRLAIPTEYEDALRGLIEAPYADLSEEMKDADRREVERYWAVIEQFVSGLA
jgi:hypothetical protein